MSNKIFGERIRELREQRDLSMQELANFLEVSKSSVNIGFLISLILNTNAV